MNTAVFYSDYGVSVFPINSYSNCVFSVSSDYSDHTVFLVNTVFTILLL